MIKVLLFADLAEKAGQGKLEIPSEEMKIVEIRHYLSETYPKLATSIKSAMPAKNEEYASDQAVAYTGDTVAFIPPVSGG